MHKLSYAEAWQFYKRCHDNCLQNLLPLCRHERLLYISVNQKYKVYD